MNEEIKIGDIVTIIRSNRPSDIGAIGLVIYINGENVLVKTFGGNMLIKTNLDSVV